VVFSICTLFLYRSTFLAGFHTMAHSLPMALSGFGILILLIVLFRVDYSRSILLLSCMLTMLWFPLRVRLMALYSMPYFYLVPGGRPLELQNLKRLHCATLQKPELPGKCDGIIADLQTELPEQWSHFLAEATLKQVPVYDASIVYEASSGRIPLDHLSNNRLGMLLPSTLYILWKRIFDALVAAVLLALLAAPILLIAAAILVSSGRSVLFTQKRAGLHGDIFTVYKFRTMITRPDAASYITRLGAWLRHFRLDELPQLWNILRGDMSLIGPRPLSSRGNSLAELHHQMPFHRHRYAVRPGITGWAQITQGHTPDEDVPSMREKLERDLYYIKHISLWLDLLIIILTVLTVITGRGAR